MMRHLVTYMMCHIISSVSLLYIHIIETRTDVFLSMHYYNVILVHVRIIFVCMKEQCYN